MTVAETPILAAAVSLDAEPVRTRYLATLFAQGVQLGFSIVTASMVPRALGPAMYGNYNFLLTTSQTIRAFVEPSAEQAFFTFSSQERHSGYLTKLYGLTLLGQLALVMGVVAVTAYAGVSAWVWPGQRVDHIILVTLADWAGYLVLSLRQLGDSKGITLRPQVIAATASATGFLALLVLFLRGELTFVSFATVNLTTSAIAGGALAFLLLGRRRDLCFDGSPRGRVRQALRRWWSYAAPLVALEYYTPLAGFLGTYLVQRWYGSTEQGLLALGTRWSAFLTMFTASATMIVWREVTVAMSTGNVAHARATYLRFDRALFFVTLVLSVALAASSRTLVSVAAGPAYTAAVPVLAIMAFYPLAQTYGQLNTAVLKAAEWTKAFGALSFAISIPGLALTYLLLAPPSATIPGLGLGAVGMALRTTAYGLVSVQVFEIMTCRLFELSYGAALLRKIRIMALVFGCGLTFLWGAPFVLNQIGLSVVPSLVIALTMYLCAVGALVVLNPTIAGANRDDLASLLKSMRVILPPFQTGVARP